MTNEDWYSQNEINARAKEQEREDIRDLQDEIAGRDTGKMTRFTSDGYRAERSGQEPEAKKQSHINISLQILLEDTTYRSAYDEAMRALQEAESFAQGLLDETQNLLSRNDQELVDIQSRASTLPDGTRVYRGKGGNVFDEAGSEVDPINVEAVLWRDDNPSFEDFEANRERNTALQERTTNIYDYQVNTLGYIRGRMTDPDNPTATTDELQELRQEMEQQKPDIRDKAAEGEWNQDRSYSSNAAVNTAIPTLS